MTNSNWFSKFSTGLSTMAGKPATFVIAVVLVVVWGVSGPMFHFSDTWQLVINTSTTIVTFLMVFLIQNTQNRDTAAIQLKLDELIRANENARNAMLTLEDLTEEQLLRLKSSFARIAGMPEAAQEKLRDARDVLAEAGEKVEQAQETIDDIGAVAAAG